MFLPEFNYVGDSTVKQVVAEYTVCKRNHIKKFSDLMNIYTIVTKQTNHEVAQKLNVTDAMVWNWKNEITSVKHSRIKDIAKLLDMHPTTVAMLAVRSKKDIQEKYGIAYVIFVVTMANGITLEEFTKVMHASPRIRSKITAAGKPISFTSDLDERLCDAFAIDMQFLQYLCKTEVSKIKLRVSTVAHMEVSFKNYMRK